MSGEATYGLHLTSVCVWPGHLSVKSEVDFTQECLDSELTITHLIQASTAGVGHCQQSSALSLYLIRPRCTSSGLAEGMTKKPSHLRQEWRIGMMTSPLPNLEAYICEWGPGYLALHVIHLWNYWYLSDVNEESPQPWCILHILHNLTARIGRYQTINGTPLISGQLKAVKAIVKRWDNIGTLGTRLHATRCMVQPDQSELKPSR